MKDYKQLELWGNRILVKEPEQKDFQENGIIMDTKVDNAFMMSEVVSVGPDVTKVIPGDIVLQSVNSGRILRIGTKYYAILSETELIGQIHEAQ